MDLVCGRCRCPNDFKEHKAFGKSYLLSISISYGMFNLKGVKSEKLGYKLERTIQRYNLNALTDSEIEIIEDENLPRLFGSRRSTIYIKSLAQSSSIELLALFLLHELAHLKGIRSQKEAMNFAYSNLKLGLLKRLKLEAELFLSEAFRIRGEVDRGAERALESW